MTTLSAIPVKVPPITQRTRIPQEAIDYVVWQIAEKFQPSKIILFGSYAYGTPRPESDVDVLVIMDSPLKESELSFQIRKSIEYNFGIDLVIKTPKDLKRRIDLGDVLLKEIVRKGKVVYERVAR
jgi:predicted nucleotidyltransferase